MIYFTSDTHFGHNNIIRYCNRPFEAIQPGIDFISAVEVMDRALIRNWNSVVKDADTVYFLGDLSFYDPEKTIKIVKQLKGKKYWIVGNHDKKVLKNPELVSLFESVKDMDMIHVQDPTMNKGRQRIVLCHYPLMSWESSTQGSWSLHGHCHGTLKEDNDTLRADIGVDCWDYAPVSYERIKKKMQIKLEIQEMLK